MIKKITIIVVNWNCGALTRVAIEPYLNYQSNKIICEIIIVDNGSGDDSLSILRPYPVQIIANATNTGFGHACNQAFEHADADYILLLNPDTQSTPEILEVLVDFLESNPAYAVAGPKQVNEKGEIIRSCGRFPTFKTALFELLGLAKLLPAFFTPTPLMTDWNHLQSRDVDHIMGSYMLIKKKVIDITGFMDKDYFVYWEDIDLSKRIANAGFKSYYKFQTQIFHEGGGSGQSVTALRLFYSIAARRIYWKKHLGKPATPILTLLSLIIEPPLRIIYSLFKKGKTEIKFTTSAYLMYIKSIWRKL